MSIYSTIALGSIAGFHAASYGAYKDSPHEGFKLNRYFREIILSIIIALIFLTNFPQTAEITTKLIFFLVVLAWSRIITEAYKLFFRIESQKNYLIPSQVHFFRKIVTKRYQRIFLGMFTACAFIVFLSLANYVSIIFRGPLLGALIGLIAGIATALGGGYKDGLFEGFSIGKFFRSPIIGFISGFILASTNVIHTHTHQFCCSLGQLD